MATEAAPLALVTGASGYVATWLIKVLLENGEYRVRGTVRDKSKQQKIQPLLDLVPDAKYPLELVEADLGDPSGWGPAVDGCTYVFHVASPFPPPSQKITDENVLIKPAVDGVINVLSACSKSGGSVKRVVVTSSVAAVSTGMIGNPGRQDNYVYTEDDWSDEATCPPYEKSKLRAERAAWEFVEKLEDDQKFELVVVNPGYIQGPLLSAASGAGSASIATSLLNNNFPGLPNATMSVVDVRDVASAQIAAMTTATAAGKRFILSGSSVTMKEMALIVKAEFQQQGYNITTFVIPKFIMWGAKFFDSGIKSIYGGINKKLVWGNERMVSELGIQPRPLQQSVIDTCYSLIELGLARKTPQYRGPPGSQVSTTEQPATEQPATEQPATEQPAIEQPATEEPASDQPAIEQPATEQPASDQPATEPPATEQPASDQPATEESASDQPATEQPATEEPATEQLATEEPATEQPAPEQPASDMEQSPTQDHQADGEED